MDEWLVPLILSCLTLALITSACVEGPSCELSRIDTLCDGGGLTNLACLIAVY